jgi:hypothetical protein
MIINIEVTYPSGSLGQNEDLVTPIELIVGEGLDDEQICDIVWAGMNQGSGKEFGEFTNDPSIRSMCVGDTIAFDGKTYVVEQFGFSLS